MGGAAERTGTLAFLAVAVLAALAAPGSPAHGQDQPVGPCSPYRAADGDIPSEMPGCAARRRPAAGSLADELEFRRARTGGQAREAAEPDGDDPAPVPRRRRATRPPSR